MGRSRLIGAFVAFSLLTLGAYSADARYTGRTTDRTYNTASLAARSVGAMYMNKYTSLRRTFGGAVHAKNLRTLKLIKRSRTGVSQTWLVGTKRKITSNRNNRVNLATAVVKIRSLQDGGFKAYSQGKTRVKIAKPRRW